MKSQNCIIIKKLLCILPSEIVEIIRFYLFFHFKNESELRDAVNMWCSSSYHSNALSRYGHISCWDVAEISNMSSLFRQMFNFNDDISNWDMSNINKMSFMFNDASAFNQPLAS